MKTPHTFSLVTWWHLEQRCFPSRWFLLLCTKALRKLSYIQPTVFERTCFHSPSAQASWLTKSSALCLGRKQPSLAFSMALWYYHTSWHLSWRSHPQILSNSLASWVGPEGWVRIQIPILSIDFMAPNTQFWIFLKHVRNPRIPEPARASVIPGTDQGASYLLGTLTAGLQSNVAMEDVLRPHNTEDRKPLAHIIASNCPAIFIITL